MTAAAPRAPERQGVPVSLALALGFGTLIALAVAATLWVSLNAAKENALRLIGVAGGALLDSMSEQVQQHLSGAANQADFIAEFIAAGKIEDGQHERLYDILAGSMAAAPEILAIAYLRADGGAMGVTRGAEGIEHHSNSWGHYAQGQAWMRWAAESTSPNWFGFHWSKALGVPTLAYVHPLHRDNRHKGAVISLVSLAALSKFITEINRNRDATGFILAGERRVIAHEAAPAIFSDLRADGPLPRIEDINDPYLELFAARQSLTPMRIDATDATDGIDVLMLQNRGLGAVFATREVVGFGLNVWRFGIYAPMESVHRPFKNLMVAAGIGLAILLAAVLFSFLLSRAIARPIARLAAASSAIGRLDLAAAQPVQSSLLKEIRSAGRAYNAMLAALRWFELYMPRHLVLQLMRHGGEAVRSQNREVTILFTDIVGFTALGSQLSAEDLAALLNSHFEILAKAIEAEDGTIDKYIGDSVMAFWGAPEPQEDQVPRALRAVSAAAAAIEADNEKRRERGLPPITIRAGLHRGEAIVGNIGAPGRINYTLIGDAVNRAQRIEAAGKTYYRAGAAATVLLSASVAEAAGPAFKLQPLGPVDLRGLSESIDLYLLVLDKGP